MKKILRILGILLGGGIVALLLLGLLVRQVSYTTTVDVKAPVAASWATFADGDRLGEWMKGLSEVELLEGPQDSVGSRYRLHFDTGETLDEHVTAMVSNELYAFDLETSIFTGSVRVTFVEHNNGTRITQTTTVRGAAFHWRALLPVIKPLMQNSQMQVLDALAAVIEKAPSAVPVVESDTLQASTGEP